MMIKKPTVIITSLGRTGTQFFSTFFGQVLPDCTSLHEPDIWNIVQYRGTGELFKQVFRQLLSGFFKLDGKSFPVFQNIFNSIVHVYHLCLDPVKDLQLLKGFRNLKSTHQPKSESIHFVFEIPGVFGNQA